MIKDRAERKAMFSPLHKFFGLIVGMARVYLCKLYQYGISTCRPTYGSTAPEKSHYPPGNHHTLIIAQRG